MSLRDLASLLNSEARAGRISITETEDDLLVSKLSAGLILRLANLARTAGLGCATYDDQYSLYRGEDIADDFGPFRLTLKKPPKSPEEWSSTLFILTAVGFSDFLRKSHKAEVWRVLGIGAPFTCQARIFGDWDEPLSLTAVSATKSPRMLVKEAADTRAVPDDIRLWLLQGSSLEASDAFHCLWASHAYDALARCLANEVAAGERRLVFKGPPKLSLEYQDRLHDVDDLFDLAEFKRVHDAAAWVYESSREVEMKHVLLSTEIARSGRADGEVIEYFRENLEAALECAKIAYQMSISDVTKDTLKSLGDLRKAVTDETSKATDATRQTVTAITTAAGIGIGLAVTRMSIAVSPWLILAVMIVVLLYVITIAWSGWHFILVQRDLRVQWQTKLYRFLSASDYKAMVTEPVERSERVFKRTAIGGVTALIVWAICVVIFAFHATPAQTKGISAPDQAPNPPPVTVPAPPSNVAPERPEAEQQGRGKAPLAPPLPGHQFAQTRSRAIQTHLG